MFLLAELKLMRSFCQRFRAIPFLSDVKLAMQICCIEKTTPNHPMIGLTSVLHAISHSLFLYHNIYNRLVP